MNVTVNKTVLVDALKKLGHFVGKSGMEKCVKIYVQQGDVTLAVGQYGIYASTKIEAVGTQANGLVVIEFKNINDFLKKVKTPMITLTASENNVLSIEAAKIKYTVLCQPSDSFPMEPNEKMEFITLDAADYKQVLNSVTYAVATSESRPVLQGVNILLQNGSIRFVATDSHRLSLYKMDQPSELTMNIVAPGETLKKTLKALEKQTKSVKLGFNEKFTLIQVDDTAIYASNLDWNYPEVDRLFPDSPSTHVTFNTSDMLEVLDVLQPLTKEDKNSPVKMKLNGSIELSASSVDKKMDAIIDGKKTGDDVIVTFNIGYMTEALKAISTDKVCMELSGSMRPFVLESSDALAKHLILPIRTYQ